MKWALIGVGKMGKAILDAWLRAGQPAENVFIKESTHEKDLLLEEAYGVSILNTMEDLKNCDAILFAVKPHDLQDALQDSLSYANSDALLISIAAGVSLDAMEHWVQQSVARIKSFPLARVMPNLPVKVGEGYSAFTCNKYVEAKHKLLIETLFSHTGQLLEMPESKFAAVTAIAGSGPAFVAIFLEALADAAVYSGLSREEAYQISAQTLLGTAKLVLDESLAPSTLKDQVCSPAGTSIYGIRAIEEGGLRASVYKAVEEALKRSASILHGHLK